MTTRTLAVLAAALIALALVAWYGTRSDSPASAVGERLLPALEDSLADVDRVVVTRAGNETVATLERRDDRWVLAEKDGYPADVTKLRGVLGALANARIVEEKTSNPEYYARLGVEPVTSAEAFGIELAAFAEGDEAVAVVVGDDAGAGYHYVRVADDAPSYMIDRALDVPRRPLDWLDREIIDIGSDRVSRITIEHPDGETLQLVRESADVSDFTVEGVPEGRELTSAGAANVVANALRTLRFDDVAAARDTMDASTRDSTGAATGDAAGEPAALDPTVATFETFDGLIVRVAAEAVGEERWITLAAETTAEATTEATTEGAGDAARTEADAINARVSGWRYRIPTYPYGQLTRRMEDLLTDASDATTGTHGGE